MWQCLDCQAQPFSKKKLTADKPFGCEDSCWLTFWLLAGDISQLIGCWPELSCDWLASFCYTQPCPSLFVDTKSVRSSISSAASTNTGESFIVSLIQLLALTHLMGLVFVFSRKAWQKRCPNLSMSRKFLCLQVECFLFGQTWTELNIVLFRNRTKKINYFPFLKSIR